MAGSTGLLATRRTKYSVQVGCRSLQRPNLWQVNLLADVRGCAAFAQRCKRIPPETYVRLFQVRAQATIEYSETPKPCRNPDHIQLALRDFIFQKWALAHKYLRSSLEVGLLLGGVLSRAFISLVVLLQRRPKVAFKFSAKAGFVFWAGVQVACGSHCENGL